MRKEVTDGLKMAFFEKKIHYEYKYGSSPVIKGTFR